MMSDDEKVEVALKLAKGAISELTYRQKEKLLTVLAAGKILDNPIQFINAYDAVTRNY